MKQIQAQYSTSKTATLNLEGTKDLIQLLKEISNLWSKEDDLLIKLEDDIEKFLTSNEDEIPRLPLLTLTSVLKLLKKEDRYAGLLGDIIDKTRELHSTMRALLDHPK